MKEKIEWYREVLELEPNSKIFFPFAKLLAEDGQIHKAIDVLEKGLERHTEYLEARLFLIELLFSTHQKEACTRQINQLSAMFASYAGFWQAWAACLAEEPGESDTASILRFLAANFISGPIKLHDVIDKGLKAILGENQAEGNLSERRESKENNSDKENLILKNDDEKTNHEIAPETDNFGLQSDDLPEENLNNEDKLSESGEDLGMEEPAQEESPDNSIDYLQQKDETELTQEMTEKLGGDSPDFSLEDKEEAIETDNALTDFAEDLSHNAVNDTESEKDIDQNEEMLNLKSEELNISAEMEEVEEIHAEAQASMEDKAPEDIIEDSGKVIEDSLNETQPELEPEADMENLISATGDTDNRVEEDRTAASIEEGVVSEIEEDNVNPVMEVEEPEETLLETVKTDENFVEPVASLNSEEDSPANLSLEENVEDILKDALQGENIENLLKTEELETIDIPDVPDIMVETAPVEQPVINDAYSRPKTEEEAFDALIDTLADQSLELEADSESQPHSSMQENNFIKEDLIDPVDEEELDEIFNEEEKKHKKPEPSAKVMKVKPVMEDTQEEKITLRTKSMAEVLANQGDIQGALDIYRELEVTAKDAKESAKIRAKIKNLEKKSTEEIHAEEADKQDSKKLIGILETLAKRVEARVAN